MTHNLWLISYECYTDAVVSNTLSFESLKIWKKEDSMSEVDLDDMSTDATQKQMNDNFSVLTEDDLPEADRSLMTVIHFYAWVVNLTFF